MKGKNGFREECGKLNNSTNSQSNLSSSSGLKNSDSKRTIVSSYGILGEVLPNSRFLVKNPYWDEDFPSYNHFRKKYGLQPICVIENEELYGKDFFIFKTIDKELELNNLVMGLSKWKPHLTWEAVFYLNALKHCLSSIIKAYMDTSTQFSVSLATHSDEQIEDKSLLLPKSTLPLKWVQNLPILKAGATVYTSRESDSIFYEMLAYLSSARSLLDSLVRIIRARPSIEIPKTVRRKPSFHKLKNSIEKCKMPSPLKKTIIKSWIWVSDLIDYRDCLLHYTILSKSVLPYVMVIHSDDRVIALIVELPDNSKVQSISNFRFDSHIDYLGYAHSTYLKLFELYRYVLTDTYSEVKN